MTDTIDSIAKKVVTSLLKEDKAWLINNYNTSGLDSIYGSNTFKRNIRNDYSLWYDSTLTKNWRDNEDTRDIREGIDFSKDHPDQVSADIADRVLELLRANDD